MQFCDQKNGVMKFYNNIESIMLEIAIASWNAVYCQSSDLSVNLYVNKCRSLHDASRILFRE